MTKEKEEREGMNGDERKKRNRERVAFRQRSQRKKEKRKSGKREGTRESMKIEMQTLDIAPK